MQPILSINIPTYNRANYLKILLNSLLVDVYSLGDNIEINVLDNASIDNTHEVVLEFSKNININYQCHEKNLGALMNIHHAHRAGSGRYIWVLGDDDYLRPNKLLHIYKVIESFPAVVLLSYTRLTPEGIHVGDISIGSFDKSFTINSPDFKLCEVDRLIGFISANIIERRFVDRFTPANYDELDHKGELAHAAIFYTAIAENEKIEYVAGFPLVQTVDNGYLRHDMWIHVCVKYCEQLPEYLIYLGLNESATRRFFNKRLKKEIVKRLFSEKYRGNQTKDIVNSKNIRKAFGGDVVLLDFINFFPSIFIKKIHDFFKVPRK